MTSIVFHINFWDDQFYFWDVSTKAEKCYFCQLGENEREKPYTSSQSATDLLIKLDCNLDKYVWLVLWIKFWTGRGPKTENFSDVLHGETF